MNFTMFSNLRKLVFNGFYREALSLYTQLPLSGFQLTSFDFPFLLKACARLPAVSEGQKIHAHVIKAGFDSDVYTATAVLHMCMKFHWIHEAHQMFDEMPERNLASFNAVISGFSQSGHSDEALRVFKQVGDEGFHPNSLTVASVLPACENLQQGGQVHGFAVKMGFELDVYVATAILTMYSKCKELGLAQKIFYLTPRKNEVSFNALISGFLHNGYFASVLDLFLEMKNYDKKPNSVSVISVLSACSELSALQFGKQIHCSILKSELGFDVLTGTALLDMYSKCGSLNWALKIFKTMNEKSLITWNSMISAMLQFGKCDVAVKLFEQLESQNLIPDVTTWNTMISGFSQQGHATKAIRFFIKMQLAGIKPNLTSFASLLPACSALCDLPYGRETHGYIIRSSLDDDKFITTALVDMYSKCGFPAQARRVFDGVVRKSNDLATWNAMIAGYGRNGDSGSALSIFYKMEEDKLTPNSATFTSVLSLCAHTGLVEKGWEIFMKMSSDHGLIPTAEHYACMVDLLGRAGWLREARDLVVEKAEPSPSVFASLLGACSCYLDAELGEEMATRLLELEPKNPTPLVVLSNIYAKQGRWNDVERVRKVMEDKGLKKVPGYSWVGGRPIHT